MKSRSCARLPTRRCWSAPRALASFQTTSSSKARTAMATAAERIALMAFASAQPKPRSEPYADNADWEADRDVMLARSDRRAWAVAAVATVIALASILALLAHGAWYQTVAVPIVVDK